MRLEYIGSAGTIDLTSFETRIYKANFHAYEWGYTGTEKTLGIALDQFTKQPLEYEMTVAVRGTEAAKKAALNNLLEITEQDVINMTPGKLYWNEHYLECYIIASETYPSDDFFGVERAMKIFAPHPFWIKETKRTFYPAAEQQRDEDYLDYPYNYKHDYRRESPGMARWNVDHFADSEFEMTIRGYCVNPIIRINGHTYQVFTTLEANDSLVIKSKEREAVKWISGVVSQNVFDLRAKDSSIFKRVPGGLLTFTWSGLFGFDIKLLLERSEPKW